MAEPTFGWPLLHSELPPKALKPLATHIYNVAGLSDVNEGHLIQRLFASKLPWEWRITSQSYLGHEDRTSQEGKAYRVYLAAVAGELVIEGKTFAGSGGSDNRRLDAAFKGAATVAFKNACKWAGLTSQLFLDGRAMDHIYDSPEKNAPTNEPSEAGPPLGLTSTANSVEPQSPASPPWTGSVEKAKAAVKPLEAKGNCPVCGKTLRTRKSQYGEFIGCSGYPDCRYVQK